MSAGKNRKEKSGILSKKKDKFFVFDEAFFPEKWQKKLQNLSFFDKFF